MPQSPGPGTMRRPGNVRLVHREPGRATALGLVVSASGRHSTDRIVRGRDWPVVCHPWLDHRGSGSCVRGGGVHTPRAGWLVDIRARAVRRRGATRP